MLGIRGNAYRAKGQYDSAIEDYSAAIGLKHPDDSVTFYNRGLAYYARAIEDYNEAIAPHSVPRGPSCVFRPNLTADSV
jgi:tetratricopeptide (TPR) repeat protein